MRFKYYNTYKDSQGNALSGGSATVYTDSGSLATIYSAETGGSAIAGSIITTDTNGAFEFYVDTIDYPLTQQFNVTVSKLNYSSSSITDITIFPSLQYRYIADPSETDQGIAGAGNTINVLVDAIGSDVETIYLPPGAYTLTTSETIPDNILLYQDNGAIIDGAGTLTISRVNQSLNQKFGTSITVEGLEVPVVDSWFGPDVDGITDDTAKYQALIAAAITNHVAIKFVKEGTRVISDTLDFSGWTSPPRIYCEGDIRIQVAASFGNQKDLFRFPGTSGSRVGKPMISGKLYLIGSEDEDNDPIAINAPFTSVMHIDDVIIENFRNTALYAPQAWDLHLNKVRIYNCGWADEYKDLSSVTVSITASDQTLTSSGSVFAVGDVGKYIAVDGADDNGRILWTTIDSYTSGTEVELTDAAGTTVSGEKAAFAPATGDFTGTTTVTSDTSMFQSSDVGRRIYIYGADTSSGILCTTVATYVSGTEITVTDTTAVSGSGFIYWSPAVFIGRPKESVSPGTDNTNTVFATDCNIERHKSIGLILKSGANFYADIKLHGAFSNDANWGISTDLVVIDSFKGARFNREATYGLRSQFNLTGGESTIETDCVHSQMGEGGFPWYLDCVNASRLIVSGGALMTERGAELVSFGSSNEISQVYFNSFFEAGNNFNLTANKQWRQPEILSPWIVAFPAPVSGEVVAAFRPPLVWGHSPTDNIDHGFAFMVERVDITTPINLGGGVGVDSSNYWKIEINDSAAAGAGNLESVLVYDGATNTRNTTVGPSGERMFEGYAGFSNLYGPNVSLRIRFVEVGSPTDTPVDGVVTVWLRIVRR